jgi:hypothetical protein
MFMVEGNPGSGSNNPIAPSNPTARDWFIRYTWALALSFSCLVWTVVIGLLILI